MVLSIAFALLSIRLGDWILRFGNESLQQDLASYYVAAQSVAQGQSPYDNLIGKTPPLWDGVASHRHSRFLYLPIVAWGLRPLTWVSYSTAKWLWMLGALLSTVGAMWLAARATGVRLDAARGLVLAVTVVAFFPLLALLERGQIDSVTLALLMVAVGLMATRQRPMLAGVALAVATAIKLQGVYLLPFLLIRRQWNALLGFAVCALGIVLLSLSVHGPAPLLRYVQDELPRISRYGDRGPRDTRIDPRLVSRALGNSAPGRTRMQGNEYAVDLFAFELNASAVRTPVGKAIWNAMRGLGLPAAPAHVSLVFLALGFAVMAGWQRWCGPPPGRLAEFAYWQAVLVLMLLCSPLTWAMGATWLLPVAVVVLVGVTDRNDRADTADRAEVRAAGNPGVGRNLSLPAGFCALGLILAGAPDAFLAFAPPLVRFKYVAAELLCFAGLLGIWRASALRREVVR